MISLRIFASAAGGQPHVHADITIGGQTTAALFPIENARLTGEAFLLAAECAAAVLEAGPPYPESDLRT